MCKNPPVSYCVPNTLQVCNGNADDGWFSVCDIDMSVQT